MVRRFLTGWMLWAVLSMHTHAEPEKTISGVLVTEHDTEFSGVVRYEKDASKPWRLGRYYIKGIGGQLSDTVIELVPVGNGLTLDAGYPRQAKTHLMDQENFMFIPETLVMQLGDKVCFKNSEAAFHNVMCLDGKSPFNVNLAKGQEHVHEPRSSGGIQQPLRIRCVFHGAMEGWIYIFPHRFYHKTTQTGSFHFTGFPPGRYKLRVTHPAGKLLLETDTLTFREGSSEFLDISMNPEHLIKDEESKKDHSRQ
ncbi:carboxypeptidase regulatory-like domain-containing protein [bacterium]|nr:carboxypeptidase regulatory-like domain-containing protein [bacterium]MDG1893174.1 carboxypeptidase regulatory-like domain-containing protein [Verrucomicrobiota bacterium]